MGGGKIYYSNGMSEARGVAILFRKNLGVQIHNTVYDEQGQFILVHATISNKKWVLVNLYAPNVDNPTFFQEAMQKVERFNPDHLIMGGDLNLGLDTVDRVGLGFNNDKSAKWLVQYFEEKQIIDT